MKKIIYFFLTVSLIFSSCKKEEDEVVTPTVITGCMDSDAANYMPSATVNSGCLYDITGAVWGITSLTINGANEMNSNVAVYLWANGDYGSETWSLDGETLLGYEGGPGIGSYSIPTTNSITLNSGGGNIATFSIDVPLNDNDNMTWRTTDSNGGAVVTTLIRSNWSLNDWK